MAKRTAGSVGLGILAAMRKDNEAKAKAKAAKGTGGGARSMTDLERLLANTGVTRTKDGTVLLRVANSFPKRGKDGEPNKAPVLRAKADHEEIDRLAANLHAIVEDKTWLEEGLVSFDRWAENK